MGASSSSSSSKSPAWYPGEPSADVSLGHGYCYYGDAHSSGKKVERNIATLPVVELVGMKVRVTTRNDRIFALDFA